MPTDGTILLDSGTTTQAIADHFPRTAAHGDHELVAIAATLSEIDTVALYVLRGRVHPHRCGRRLVESSTPSTTSAAFLPPSSGMAGTVARGMTTPDQVEAGAKRAMAAAARRVVVVTDSTKAGQEHFHRFAKLEDVDLLITDTNRRRRDL